MADCRKRDAKWLKKAKDGEARCQICMKNYTQRASLLNHIFCRHSELEICAVYGRRLDEFFSKKELLRLRAPFMTAIK